MDGVGGRQGAAEDELKTASLFERAIFRPMSRMKECAAIKQACACSRFMWVILVSGSTILSARWTTDAARHGRRGSHRLHDLLPLLLKESRRCINARRETTIFCLVETVGTTDEKPSVAKSTKRLIDRLSLGRVHSRLFLLFFTMSSGSRCSGTDSALLQDTYNRYAADAVFLATNIENSHPNEFRTREGIIGVVGPEIERRQMIDKLVTAAKALNAIALCHESWTCTVELPNYDDIVTEFWGTYRDVLLPLRPNELPGFCATLERETARIMRGSGLAQASR